MTAGPERSGGYALLALVHARTLLARPGMDLLAVALLALVCCLAGLGFMLMESVDLVFRRSGDPSVVLVTARGSNGEAESFLEPQDVSRLKAFLSDAGWPGLDYSGQLVMSASMDDADGQRFLSVRGLPPDAPSPGATPRIVAGRMFDPRLAEVVVGEAAMRSFPDLRIGGAIELGTRSWTVSGVFAMGGDVRENEVVGSLEAVQGAYGAGTIVSSVRIAAASAAEAERIVAAIDGEPSLTLSAIGEHSYFSARAQPIARSVARLQLIIMALLLPACLLGLLAIQRVQHSGLVAELRSLALLGFQSSTLRASFVLRSAAGGLAAAAAAIGVLWLGVAGRSARFVSGLHSVDLGFAFSPWIALVLAAGCAGVAAAAGLMGRMDRSG